MSKIYIAGPMSGLPGFNRPAFHRAAAHIVRRGNVALNPAILPDGLEQVEYMDICLALPCFAALMASSCWTVGNSLLGQRQSTRLLKSWGWIFSTR